MDLEKLYQSLIMRDLLEYFLPGAIVFSGLVIIIESTVRILDPSLTLTKIDLSLVATLALGFGVSYAAGHLLSSFDNKYGRKSETTFVINILKESESLRDIAIPVLEEYFDIDANALLTQLTQGAIVEGLDKRLSTFRELARSIIYINQNQLYRDFVNRHSIFSRFCMNMANAIKFMLICAALSIVMNLNSLGNLARNNLWHLSFASGVLVLFLLLAIYLFSQRSKTLRKTMIKHTFQLLYVDYLMHKKQLVKSHKKT